MRPHRSFSCDQGINTIHDGWASVLALFAPPRLIPSSASFYRCCSLFIVSQASAGSLLCMCRCAIQTYSITDLKTSCSSLHSHSVPESGYRRSASSQATGVAIKFGFCPEGAGRGQNPALGILLLHQNEHPPVGRSSTPQLVSLMQTDQRLLKRHCIGKTQTACCSNSASGCHWFELGKRLQYGHSIEVRKCCEAALTSSHTELSK